MTVTAGVEDVGTMRAVWLDPTGVQWELTDISDTRGWFTTDKIGGWGATTYEIVTDPHARRGETVRHVRGQPSRVQWPMHFYGENHLQYVQRIRLLRRAIMMTVHRPHLGPGRLIVARPDGEARYIDCLYEKGFEGEPGEDWLWSHPVIGFFCPDGSWRDVRPTVIKRSYSPTRSFFSPFLSLSSSRVLGETVMHNPGDLPAWPEWTITGPATQIVATNHTLGQSFTLNAVLLAGEQVTISTDRPMVRGPGGPDDNLVDQLNWPECELWGLDAEDNHITFAVSGAGPGTDIQLLFYARYEGA